MRRWLKRKSNSKTAFETKVIMRESIRNIKDLDPNVIKNIKEIMPSTISYRDLNHFPGDATKYIAHGKSGPDGVAVFHLTNNGEAGGDPLFKHIQHVSAIGINNTSDINSIPIVSLKLVSLLKVEVNVLLPKSSGVILGGIITPFVFGANQEVWIEVSGIIEDNQEK